MKFCEECGAKLDDAALFCDECGAKIEETVIVKDGNKKSTKNPSPGDLPHPRIEAGSLAL